MIKLDNKHLMMIEPKCNPVEILDELTEKSIFIWERCKFSGISYRGFHRCICGVISDNKDWITPMGRVTNSLLVHYVRFHRISIPAIELDKIFNEYMYLKYLK